MLPLINSGGFFASTIPASTKPQFATGPQKCTVRGPVGESISALNLDPSVVAFPAMGCDSSEAIRMEAIRAGGATMRLSSPTAF
jgi:hypothetical protein